VFSSQNVLSSLEVRSLEELNFFKNHWMILVAHYILKNFAFFGINLGAICLFVIDK